MSRKVFIENPPLASDEAALNEWLARLMVQTDLAFQEVPDWTPTGQLPDKVENGMVRYFSIPILPDIEEPGPYMYIEGQWVFLGTEGAEHISWKKTYEAGITYEPYDQLYSPGYLAIANTETTEYPFPLEVGVPIDLYDGENFSSTTELGLVQSGIALTTTKLGQFKTIEVWIPSVAPEITYSLLVILNPNTDPVADRFPLTNNSLMANEWNVVSVPNSILALGQEVLVFLESQNSDSNTSETAIYDYAGQNNVLPPVSGEWNTNNQNNLLRISSTPKSGTATLGNIVTGSVIGFTNGPEKIRYLTTSGPSDQGTHTEWSVDLLRDDGIAIGEETIMLASIPVAAPTEFVYQLNKWTDDPPSWCTIESYLYYNDQQQPAATSVGYGINIKFQELEVSPDYDIIVLGGSGAVGGGGGDDPELEARVTKNEQDIDTNQSNIQTNTDFSAALSLVVDGNKTDIADLVAWEAATAPIISKNVTDIANLQDWEVATAPIIDANRTRSLQNETDIQTNTDFSAALSLVVDDNTQAIGTLQFDTFNLGIRVGDNETNIQANTDFSAALSLKVDTNKTDIDDLQAWEAATAPIIAQNSSDIDDLQAWEAATAPIIAQNSSDIDDLQAWEAATAPILADVRDELARQENITIINSAIHKMLVTDGTIIIDVSSNGVNCILPNIVDVLGKKFTIKNLGGGAGFAAYSTDDGASIDFQPGAAGYALEDKESITLQAGTTGNIWYRVGGYKL